MLKQGMPNRPHCREDRSTVIQQGLLTSLKGFDSERETMAAVALMSLPMMMFFLFLSLDLRQPAGILPQLV